MSTFNYRLKISYDGFGFEGWQVQPKGHKTIQGELNSALAKIAKSEEVSSLGSGRTDSGVHALGQIVRIQIPLDIETTNLLMALNSHLPKSIRIIEVTSCDDNFHPVRDALWKRYVYLVSPTTIMPPHLRHYVTGVRGEVDWQQVERALKLFEGEHDFINFSTKGTEVSSTVRSIFLTHLEKMESAISPGSTIKVPMYKMTFEGSGFLKQMVRLLVGTVIAAGQNKITLDQISDYLRTEHDQKLAAVAASQGLYLDHVEYLQAHPKSH